MWKLDSLLRETLRYHGIGLRKQPTSTSMPDMPVTNWEVICMYAQS